jgi:hypothetical protein
MHQPLPRIASLITILAVISLGACTGHDAGNSSFVEPAKWPEPAAELAMDQFLARDPTLKRLITSAYGHAVFPRVTVGPFGLGTAQGKDARVWQKGRIVGTAELNQVSLLTRLGDEDFAQLMVFRDKAALDRFKAGRTKLDKDATAVVATSGAAAASTFF